MCRPYISENPPTLLLILGFPILRGQTVDLMHATRNSVVSEAKQTSVDVSFLVDIVDQGRHPSIISMAR